MASSANLEEESGVIKSGSVIAGFAPIKSRKTYYAVLCERALELHESEKTYRKRKSARHLIDLSTAFNVHNDHFDPKLKRCVCLMGPDETLCLKVDDGAKSGDDGRQNTEWYNAIMSALIPSRALRLGRPIQPLEFFECAWDVDVVSMPKLKRPPRTEDSLQNICVRLPEIAGAKRLCFYAHTIILCKRRIEPAVSGLPPSGIPPFQVDDFTEIPRKCVAFFGCQEKFFLMRLGRGAPSGASELWAQCDNEEVALDIHNKLNAIIERESEKERKMNNGIIKPPGLLSLRSHQSHHRDRCHTQPQRTRTSSFMSGRVSTVYSSNSPIGSKPTTPSAPAGSSLGSRAYSISYGSQTPTRNQPPAASAFMSVFPQRQASLDESSVYQAMVPTPTSNPLTTHPAAELTADNGGSAIYTKAKQDRLEERKLSTVSHTTVEETITTPLSTSRNETPTTFDDGYTPMHAAEWSSAGSSSHLIMPTCDRYKLEEVRSYVSDSSDYCSTTGAANGCSDLQSPANPPRAYSFAGRCNLRPTSTNTSIAENTETRTDITTGGLLQPAEDPRKRAFSLGSKTLFQRPFRKISQHSSRQQRVSQTSASSVSLASSEFSSSFGPSSSANHLSALNCSEKDDYSRNRSGSFGSGRSTPHNRKGAAPQDGAGHFLEMDFGSGIRRSGSGSVVSVDSPSNCIRSRTSSFGCAIRKDTEVFSYPADLAEAELTPSQIVLEQARQSSIDETCDYVIPVAPDLEAVKNALAEASEHHHIGFPSRIDSKSIDMHSSQHFETIEESASLKSSPCSSRSSLAMDDESTDKAETSRMNDYISIVEHRSDVVKNPLMGSPCADRPASSPPPKERETNTTTLLPQQSPISSARSKSGIVFSHNLETGKPLLDYASIKPVRAMSY